MGKAEMWKSLWETWDIRVLILISLSLQILLIVLAPLRKRVSSAWINMPTWSAYLLADIVAIYVVGLISRNQGDASGPPNLLAFWAAFLLVHLGGPDTITAFSLADNELWLRHFLGLVSQSWAVGYSFIKSSPKHSMLWIPTLLIFLAGLIKYIERTRALYLASEGIFKDSLLPEPDAGPDYAKLMDEYTSKMKAKLPTMIEMIPEPPSRNDKLESNEADNLSCLEVLQTAHKNYTAFKGLIGDMIFSTSQRNESRDCFLKLTTRDAFHVIEVELNFFYDILYTKAWVVRHKFLGCRLGYFLHIVPFISTLAALLVFYFVIEKNFDKFDIAVSYTLLAGAIVLDLIAFLKILCSDWFAVTLANLGDNTNRFITILKCLLAVNRERWPTTPRQKPKWYSPRIILHIVGLRWSESLSQYNLINCCLHPREERWEKTIAFFSLTNMLDGMKYVDTVDFVTGLKDLIFDELKTKSELADDSETAKEIFSSRGDWILRQLNHPELLCWINDVNFDESIVLWHVATELCYYKEVDDKSDKRKFSKHLSDYLLYLLIMQSTMLSNIAGIGQRRLRDTRAEAKRFFSGRKISEDQKLDTCCKRFCCCFSKCCSSEGKKKRDESLWKNACESILKVNTEVEPSAIKGDRSKSLLFDACRLAKELMRKGSPEMWTIISKVWVELLSYVACHCRAQAHVAQLSKGGQLVTLVWLLMTHLGLSDQFQIKEGHARAKLIVMK